MAAQAKGKISERRDRRTAHCDYREHLKSLGGEGGAGNWSRRPQWDMGGGGHLDSGTSTGQASGPRQSESQGVRQGNDLT